MIWSRDPARACATIVTMLRTCVTILISLFAAGEVAVAQESTTGAQIVPAEEEIEEVVVYGEKTLVVLREMVHRAEENFYDIFSELSTNDDFDVRCFMETPTGTRIPKHVCRAKFVTEAETEWGQAWIKDWAAVPAHTAIAVKRRQMEQEMERLVLERPELQAALVDYVRAKEVYAAERKRRCEGLVFVCR